MSDIIPTTLDLPANPIGTRVPRTTQRVNRSRTPLGAQAERPPTAGAKQAPLGAQAEHPPIHGVTLGPLGAQAERSPTHGDKLLNLVPQAEGPSRLGVNQPEFSTPNKRPSLSTNNRRKQRESPKRIGDLSSPDPEARNSKRRAVASPFGVDPSEPNLRTQAGADRNAVRLQQADREDANTCLLYTSDAADE